MAKARREPGMPAEGKTRGSGKWSKYREERSSTGSSWRDADPTQVWEAIVAVTGDGDAILFGGSRDGGVLVLTICSGNERLKLYFRDADEISDGLTEVKRAAEGEPVT